MEKFHTLHNTTIIPNVSNWCSKGTNHINPAPWKLRSHETTLHNSSLDRLGMKGLKAIMRPMVSFKSVLDIDWETHGKYLKPLHSQRSETVSMIWNWTLALATVLPDTLLNHMRRILVLWQNPVSDILFALLKSFKAQQSRRTKSFDFESNCLTFRVDDLNGNLVSGKMRLAWNTTLCLKYHLAHFWPKHQLNVINRGFLLLW